MSKTELKNLPSGHDGNAFININGTRQDAFKLAKVSAKFETIVEEKMFLGEKIQQHAVRGGKGSGDMTYYQTTDAFIKAMRDYKNGGKFPDITLQYYSQSPGSDRIEVILSNVIPSAILFGALDDSSTDAQKIDSSFTFDNFDLL